MSFCCKTSAPFKETVLLETLIGVKRNGVQLLPPQARGGVLGAESMASSRFQSRGRHPYLGLEGVSA